jgi:hypothetical protein
MLTKKPTETAAGVKALRSIQWLSGAAKGTLAWRFFRGIKGFAVGREASKIRCNRQLAALFLPQRAVVVSARTRCGCSLTSARATF